MSHDFLVELGTEELPPTALKALLAAFEQGIIDGLSEQKLSFENASAYATPRRLALRIEGLAETTPTEELQIWGPPAKIAFDKDGKPTKAAEAFASKNGIAVSDLATANDGKADKLVYKKQAGGEPTKALLANIVSQSLTKLPINKRMRWGASRNEFVRPVQWLLMLVNNDVLPAEILGVSAGNTTRGHRFHCNKTLTINSPAEYVDTLFNTGKVVVDMAARRASVETQVHAAAKSLKGNAVIDPDLLDEVTALVEWPVALAGRFEESFLAVPAEALISSMKEHQKYFHVVDDNGELLPFFITLSNIESKDPAQVIDGNERVIRPRLADAKFFFETDKKTSLEARCEKLKTVVFQAQLGSIYDKTQRVAKLAGFIADALKLNSTEVCRAAQLCKSDLVSSMVYEFADLQGIAGYHYALNDGESETVAKAIVEQYQPKFAGDTLPTTDAGAILALADRLDTIIGIFGIGQKPTGSKDPFALRRASVGALRILVEKSYGLDLRALIAFGESTFDSLTNTSVVDDVLGYMIERFRSWYEDAGFAPEVFQAVNAKQISVPLDINNRVYAVAAFSKLPEAQALAAANKRVSNILAKLETAPETKVSDNLLQENAEKVLAQKLAEIKILVEPQLAAGDYTAALTALAVLREPVDTFFDDVMVMTDELDIRNNRLALLQQLRDLFLAIADISLLVVKN